MIRVPANLSQKVRDELRIQYLRVKPLVSAARLWDRILTNREREQLGGDLGKSHAKRGTVRMWQDVRGGSDERAVVDISMAIGFLAPTDYQWLVREIGEKPLQAEEQKDEPSWDPQEGKLRLAGQVIRSVRILGEPSHVQIILDLNQAKSPFAG